jgi:effector-binding domain-containing protein
VKIRIYYTIVSFAACERRPKEHLFRAENYIPMRKEVTTEKKINVLIHVFRVTMLTSLIKGEQDGHAWENGR